MSKIKFSKPLDVLIVEDSYFFSKWLSNELLTIENIHVAALVDNVAEALNVLEQKNIDLAVIDIRLKTGLGTDILKSLKANNPNVIVIIFTNYAEFKKECLKLGADYFYDKSNEFDELVESIINLSSVSFND